VVLVANKPYAAIQHFGGMAGKGRKVKIPARPYMMIQDEDWAEIKAALNDFIIEGRL
jgi:phage gpG-like protein